MKEDKRRTKQTRAKKQPKEHVTKLPAEPRIPRPKVPAKKGRPVNDAAAGDAMRELDPDRSVPLAPAYTYRQVRGICLAIIERDAMGKEVAHDMVDDSDPPQLIVYPPHITAEELATVLGPVLVDVSLADAEGNFIATLPLDLASVDAKEPTPDARGYSMPSNEPTPKAPRGTGRGRVMRGVTIGKDEIAIPEGLSEIEQQMYVVRYQERERAEKLMSRELTMIEKAHESVIGAMSSGVKDLLTNFGYWDKRSQALEHDLQQARLTIARTDLAHTNEVQRLHNLLNTQNARFIAEVEELKRERADLKNELRRMAQEMEETKANANITDKLMSMAIEKYGERGMELLMKKGASMLEGGSKNGAAKEAAKQVDPPAPAPALGNGAA